MFKIYSLFFLTLPLSGEGNIWNQECVDCVDLRVSKIEIKVFALLLIKTSTIQDQFLVNYLYIYFQYSGLAELGTEVVRL